MQPIPPTSTPGAFDSAGAAELTEIGESAAEGRVAETYLDIRATLGVPLVNLVYRYLATRPGALAWAWGWLRPHFASGALAEQADLLRAAAARQTAGWTLDPGPLPDAERMGALVAAYNRANGLNLMALTHLLQLPAGEGGEFSPDQDDATASRMPPTSRPQVLPPLPAWADVAPSQRALVLRLNRFADGPVPQVVASLYRHLTVWPPVPALLESELARLDARGELVAARVGTAQTAARIASARPLGPRPDPSTGLDPETRLCLRTFATVTLPKMVPIGLALHAACNRAAGPTPNHRV